MDKSCQSSGDSSKITSGNSRSDTTTKDHYLKNLNKFSHKISKAIINTTTSKKPPFDPNTFNHTHNPSPQSQLPPPPQQPQQPPVYNINKNDFRDVVQKLTGSPAHERFSTPPPIQPPKPPSSRLQRIRPPPLAHVSNRPHPLLNNAIPLQQLPYPSLNAGPPSSFFQLPPAPLSPLPPFPAVYAAAESPVSAYMRYLQNSMSGVDSNKQFSGFSPLAPLVSPKWNNLVAPQPQPQTQNNQRPFPPLHLGAVPPKTSQPQFQLPTSPLPFGCLNSPRSPHPFLSPGLLLSPSAFPLSPTLPVPSPRWRGL